MAVSLARRREIGEKRQGESVTLEFPQNKQESDQMISGRTLFVPRLIRR